MNLLRPTLVALLCQSLLSPSNSLAAEVNANKQALVQRVLTLWHIEDNAIAMAQRPAIDALQQARIALQGRVTAEKQSKAMTDIASDVQRYLDAITPHTRETALRLKPPILAPLLVQEFTEEELTALITILESPVKKKFETLLPAFEKAYGDAVAAEVGPTANPKLQALSQQIGGKLRSAAMAP